MNEKVVSCEKERKKKSVCCVRLVYGGMLMEKS